MGFLTTVGAVIGAVAGFVSCSKFRWFGTFTGIVGQYIAFMFVGGLAGSMIVGSIFGLPSKTDTEDEDAYYEEADYDSDDSEYEDDVYADEDADDDTEYDEETDEEDAFYGEIPELDETDGDDYGYILPTSSQTELTEEDLTGLSAQELTYARNEIYARHGYVFNSSELNEYFLSQEWYVPDESFNGTLEGTEQYNATFISDYQEANGLTYKPD